MTKTVTIKATTNNLMSLPQNLRLRQTLFATPDSSVLMIQECDLDVFKRFVDKQTDYKHPPLHMDDDRYGSFVLWDDDVWKHKNTVFHKAYDGSYGISKTRHIDATVLEHRLLAEDFLFLSWHAVTKGNDKIRREMRAEALEEVRKIIRRHKGRMPIISGVDLNATTNPHPTSRIHVKHGIDHQNAWPGGGVSLAKAGVKVVKTPSDHDAVEVTYRATIR